MIRRRLRLDRRVGDRDGRQERDRVRVERLVVELARRGDLDDPAEVHDRDPVADVADDREVVGDEQVGQAESLLEALEQVDDLGLDRDVEGADGLVGDDEVGLERQGPGDADALPLAAGELVRIADRRSRGRARPSRAARGRARAAPARAADRRGSRAARRRCRRRSSAG